MNLTKEEYRLLYDLLEKENKSICKESNIRWCENKCPFSYENNNDGKCCMIEDMKNYVESRIKNNV